MKLVFIYRFFTLLYKNCNFLQKTMLNFHIWCCYVLSCYVLSFFFRRVTFCRFYCVVYENVMCELSFTKCRVTICHSAPIRPKSNPVPPYYVPSIRLPLLRPLKQETCIKTTNSLYTEYKFSLHYIKKYVNCGN